MGGEAGSKCGGAAGAGGRVGSVVRGRLEHEEKEEPRGRREGIKWVRCAF